MKTLYLIRHAKSSWSIDGIEDRDRPLKGVVFEVPISSVNIYVKKALMQTISVCVVPRRAEHCTLP